MRHGHDPVECPKPDSGLRRLGRAVACAAVVTFAAPVTGHAAAGTAEKEAARREALAGKAQELMAAGDALAASGDDAGAIEKYRQAATSLPAGAAAVRELRAAVVKRFEQAATREAERLATRGEFDKAAALLNEVLTDGMDPSSAAAKSLKEQLSDPDHFNPAMSPRHADNTDKVRQLLTLARGHVDVGDFDAAKAAYQQVLAVDETNTAARRGLEGVEKHISTHLRSARDHTRIRMLNEVDRQWESAVPARAVLPGVGSGAGTDSQISQNPVALKLDAIRIPRLAISEVPIADALAYLSRKSAEVDLVETDANRRGVNIVWSPGSKAAGEIRPVTLDLRNVTVRDALRSICEVTDTRFRVDASSVLVSTSAGGLVTRQFRVPPGFLNTTPAADEGASAADPFAGDAAASDSRPKLRRLTAVEYLTRRGVPFPEGSSASYNPTQNLLSVTNTDENLDLVASLTDGLVAREQKQVLIKVTQLQASELTLRELGFDWFLEPVQVNGGVFAAGGTAGGGELGSAQPVGIPGTPDYRAIEATFNVTQGPLTGGLRSSLELTAAPTIEGLVQAAGSPTAGVARPPYTAAIAGVMTSPRFQTLMRGLDQKKGVDMAIANSVVVKSGQRANGFSGRTMLYPSEFDPPQIPQNFGAGGNINLDPNTGQLIPGQGAQNNALPVTPAMPNSFTPRDLGSTIEVEPTVGDDGYSVDLNLAVNFSEFLGFINYGTPITNGDIVLTENRIIQPVFSKTAAATQVLVYDGQTVAIGGLREEKLEVINDKVPVFSSLPVVGRLFRSKVTQNRKTALMYLVTVQIVDPAGNAATDAGRAVEAAAAAGDEDSADSILLR